MFHFCSIPVLLTTSAKWRAINLHPTLAFFGAHAKLLPVHLSALILFLSFILDVHIFMSHPSTKGGQDAILHQTTSVLLWN